jgi:diguanylate cyclase (GGDEF)-like protein/PAS domain S-box-containing protein
MIMLAEMRRDTWNQATVGADNLLNATSQAIAHTIEGYDLSLKTVVDGLQDPELSLLSGRIQKGVLFDGAAKAEPFGDILVLDEDGNVTRSSGPFPKAKTDYRYREFFKIHKSQPDTGLHISKPFARRFTWNDDEPVIALSRRLNRPDGSFAGIVMGTVRLSYFKALFEGVDVGLHGAITLLRTDGTILLRSPYSPGQIGRNLSADISFQRIASTGSGSFVSASHEDGVQRVVNFVHVDTLPMILIVGLSQSDIFALWNTRAFVIGLVLLGLCATATRLGFLLNRALKRRGEAERALKVSELQYRLLAEHSTDVIMRIDRTLRCRYVSQASILVLGYDCSELVDCKAEDWLHPEDWLCLAEIIEQAQTGQGNAEATYRVRHKAGHYIWIEARYSFVVQDGGFVVVLRDISKRKVAEVQLKAANAELAKLAGSDGLTELANRRRFDEALDAECRRATRHQGSVSLLLLDVDRFKPFNDRYGHQAGDECLRQVAACIGTTVDRPTDLAARYGGEEFALMLPETDEAGAAHIAELARKAVEALGIPHEGNAECGGVVTVSVGCATLISNQDDASLSGSILVAEADRTLYEAKRLGRNRVMTPADMSMLPVAPLCSNEEERLLALDYYRHAEVAGKSDSLDRIARMAAVLLGTPTAFVSLVDRDEVIMVGRHGLATERTPRAHSFCGHTIVGSDPFVVQDAMADPRLSTNRLVDGEDAVRFYAGAPLISPDGGHRLGALCVVDRMPRPPLDETKRALLERLACLVVDDLEARRRQAGFIDSAAA